MTRKEAYNRAIENSDFSKIDKIYNGIESGRITKENFWDVIRMFTRNVTSDHSIKRWQCLADWFYNNMEQTA